MPWKMAGGSEAAAQKLFSYVCQSFSRAQLFAIPWTVAYQAPLSKGFPSKEQCSGLPFPPPEDLPDPGIEPRSLMCPAVAGWFFTTTATWEALPVLICRLFDNGHSDLYEVISHCSFDLLFSENQ